MSDSAYLLAFAFVGLGTWLAVVVILNIADQRAERRIEARRLQELDQQSRYAMIWTEKAAKKFRLTHTVALRGEHGAVRATVLAMDGENETITLRVPMLAFESEPTAAHGAGKVVTGGA